MTWLTPLERQAWIGLLACAAAVEYASDRQLQTDSGLSFRTYGILAAVSESSGGSIHMSELSGIAGHSQSRLSHAITRLESDGLVTRGDCSDDKRVVHVSLTEKGHSIVQEAAPAHVALVRRLVFDRLTVDQTAALADATRAIWRSLQEDHHVSPIAALDWTDPPAVAGDAASR
jgi:DNA-binding MarR family transcriptional regulator